MIVIRTRTIFTHLPGGSLTSICVHLLHKGNQFPIGQSLNQYENKTDHIQTTHSESKQRRAVIKLLIIFGQFVNTGHKKGFAIGILHACHTF